MVCQQGTFCVQYSVRGVTDSRNSGSGYKEQEEKRNTGEIEWVILIMTI